MDFVDVALYFAYILLFLVITAAVFLPIFYANRRASSSRHVLLFLGALLAIFAMNFFLESRAVDSAYAISALTSQWIGGMLTTMYYLVGLCVCGILFLEVARFTKSF